MSGRSDQERAAEILQDATATTALLMPRGIKRRASTQRKSTGATLIPTAALRSGAFSVRASHQMDYHSSVSELAKSIAALGIIAPIVVRKTKVGDFEVIAGERRLAAARILKILEMPCIVKECSDAEALTLSLTENLQRNNLSPIEKAMGLRRLLFDMCLTQQDVGERIGMPQSAIAHHLRLLKLPAEVQRLIHEGALSTGHGKVLAGVNDAGRAVDLAFECVAKSRSVRELEMSVSEAVDGGGDETSADSPRRTREERELPNGVFLVIKETPGEACNGKIEIPYYSVVEKEWVLKALAAGKRLANERGRPDMRYRNRDVPGVSTFQAAPRSKGGGGQAYGRGCQGSVAPVEGRVLPRSGA